MADQNNAPELPERIWVWSLNDSLGSSRGWNTSEGDGRVPYIRADRAAPEGQVPEQCPVCSGKSFAKIDGEQARWRCVECKTVTPPPAAPTQPTETTNVQKLHEMDMGDGRILTSEMPIPEPIRAPDAEQMEAYDPTTQPYDEPFRHVDHPAAPAPGIAEAARALLAVAKTGGLAPLYGELQDAAGLSWGDEREDVVAEAVEAGLRAISERNEVLRALEGRK